MQGSSCGSLADVSFQVELTSVARALEKPLVGIPFHAAPQMRASVVKGCQFISAVHDKPSPRFGYVERDPCFDFLQQIRRERSLLAAGRAEKGEPPKPQACDGTDTGAKTDEKVAKERASAAGNRVVVKGPVWTFRRSGDAVSSAQ